MVNRCPFQDNKWALVLEGGVAQIRESHLRTSEETGFCVKKSKTLVKGSVISENKSGGILLQAPDARIEHNNILNNGKWEIKILDDGNNIRVISGVVKIAVYTDGILIQFLFHILRFQVSGVRNDEQRR